MTYISPILAGGLGNVLFQIAGCYGIVQKIGANFFIHPQNEMMRTHHSTTNYFNSLLSGWKRYFASLSPTHVVTEVKLHPINRVQASPVIAIHGYLQNWSYFWDYRTQIIESLVFQTDVASKYEKLDESAFIHVRGGDYVGHPVHHVNLTHYYAEAIKAVNAPHYYIFTNDPAYLETQSWIQELPHTIVHENEVDSLYLMSKCAKGAICANSTFSWWGAFLNVDRPITMPSKWFNDPEYYIQGYFFPGVSVISV